MRSGKVVSFTGGTVTVTVEHGGGTGTDTTFKLTSSTRIIKGQSLVSTSGKISDLASLGLKAGYYVNLMVNSGNVTSLQFNADGSQTQEPPDSTGGQNQGPPPGANGSRNQGPPPNGAPPGQHAL